MTMTQRYAGMLHRHAAEWDKQDRTIQAEATRQAARHMEELQSAHDKIANPGQPMRTAPKDGTAILVLLEGSNIWHPARWIDSAESPHALSGFIEPGWHLTWDGWRVPDHDGPRYWMPNPTDPDATDGDDA